jgi:transcriptional regulator with XRE-family HTH domain
MRSAPGNDDLRGAELIESADGTDVGTGTPRQTVEPDNELGHRIRELRTERKMTLEAVAGQAGVTRSFLSTVELGRSNPSIVVLREIARSLDVPLFMLFTNPEANGVIVRPKDRGRIHPRGSPFSYELLSPNLQRKIEMIIMRLERGAQSASGAHQGEECAFLLQGAIVVTVGDVEYPMEEGDAIYFNSGLPHFVTSVGTEEAVLISAMTPPSF